MAPWLIWLGFISLVYCTPVHPNTSHPAASIAGDYQLWKSLATEVGVVILGGGVAGLTAAKVLLENNVTDILLLEADQRLGGRIKTNREGGILTEEGDELIGGGLLDPLHQLVEDIREIALNSPELEYDIRVMNSDGQEEDKNVLKRVLLDILDEHDDHGSAPRKYQSFGHALTEKCRENYANLDSDEGKAWFHVLEKLTTIVFGNENWTSVVVDDILNQLSLEDPHFWKNGLDTLVTQMTKHIPKGIVRTSTPVNKIFWDDEGRVLLVANNGSKSFLARHVIVTVPVGYLKARHQALLFQPSLPIHFTNDLNSVELDVLNKVQIGWPDQWWGSNNPLYLVLIWRNFNLPEEMEWLYGIVLIKSLQHQKNVLQAYVDGKEAVLMEKLPEDTVKEHILHLLRQSTGLPVPEPLFFRSMVGYSLQLRGVVLWAGEHVQNTPCNIVVGAMVTGERAAKEMVEILKTHPADILTGSYQIWNSSATDVGVIIVGAGVAGLSAAKTLLENNVTDILILEADHRIGGRVRTYREGDILIEEGAEWIHGDESNPLHRLAKVLGELSPFKDYYLQDSRLTTNDGQPINASVFDLIDLIFDEDEGRNRSILQYLDQSIGHYAVDRFHDEFDDNFPSTMKGNVSPRKAWLDFLELMISYEWGFDSWLNMPVKPVLQYELYGDQDYQWSNGYDTFINYIKKSVPEAIIRTSSPVSKIFWDEEGEENDGRVLVVAENGRTSYSAKHVIVTTSVGHLKERHRALFHPPLPASFAKNFDGIYLAVSDKIIIGWPEPWWGSKKPLFFFVLWTNRTLPKEMDWLYGISCVFTVHQQPNILEMFVTGDDARRMESLPEGVVRQHILHLFRSFSGLEVPEPTFFKRSKWGLDPWKRGSYCSIVTMEGVESGIQSRREFTTPLRNSKGVEVVLWAGEHTHDTRFCTVDGAMETGEREAQNLLEILKKTTKTRSSSSSQDDQETSNKSA
ncbi:uncharacterized protein [Palaemon carinicauda]|uniref:uncharacterized protein n=1 Tax=Palaemon carinicauda TaxID=392227 RepID=UPI0035B5CF83